MFYESHGCSTFSYFFSYEKKFKENLQKDWQEDKTPSYGILTFCL